MDLGLFKRLEVNALLELRNAPIDKVGKSPVQLLMSHLLRTLLPTLHHLHYPHAENPSVVREKHTEHQKQQ